jgi:flagellar basal-body rod protein FlgG
MLRGLWTAATGMISQQTTIDVCANNLANVGTSGFKKSRSNFQDLMYQTTRMPGATTENGGTVPVGIQVGMGARPTSAQKIYSQGDYENTGNELDFAIEGKGFFKILRGDEELYTRAGNFTVDNEGYICTAAGDRLQPEIALPEETTTISLQTDGTLTAFGGTGGEELQTSEVLLYAFINPAGLYAVGGNLLRATEASGEEIEGTPGSDGFGTVTNQFLEMSNVSVVEEMVAMITGQRAYEATSKALQTADSMLQMANNVKR